MLIRDAFKCTPLCQSLFGMIGALKREVVFVSLSSALKATKYRIKSEMMNFAGDINKSTFCMRNLNVNTNHFASAYEMSKWQMKRDRQK